MISKIDRLAAVFDRIRGRSALIPYITAGDPSAQSTPLLMQALVQAGADVIELGVPFSDPMADGAVIQRAAERAIARGVGLRQVLAMVTEFRRTDDTTPVVLMGYANPIERMGVQTFVDAAGRAGVDGVLVVDYPPEEAMEFAAALEAAGIAPIFLLAPTSTESRMKMVAQFARGYLYYVTLKGITGATHIDTDAVARRLGEIRRHVSLPIAVGFGIRDAASAARLAGIADAVVIGSKLIETMEAAVQALPDADPLTADSAAIGAAKAWLKGIREALDQGASLVE